MYKKMFHVNHFMFSNKLAYRDLLTNHFHVWVQVQFSYVTQVRVRGEARRLAGESHAVPCLDHCLAETGDPLLLVERVVGLEAVGLCLRAPSAAHSETVLHWGMATRERRRVKSLQTVLLRHFMSFRAYMLLFRWIFIRNVVGFDQNVVGFNQSITPLV